MNIVDEFQVKPMYFLDGDDEKKKRFALLFTNDKGERLLMPFTSAEITKFLNVTVKFVDNIFKKENLIGFLLHLAARLGFIILVFLAGYILGR